MRSIAMYIPCLVFAVMLNHVTGATLTAEKFGRDLVEFLDSEFGNTGGSPDPRGDGSSDWVYYGKRAGADPCVPNPCRNGGKCSTAEDPLIGIGMRFYCICKSTKQKKYGGYYCEIEDPCNKCPKGYVFCVPTSVDSDGKFCYDSKYKVMDTTADLHQGK